MAIETTTNPSDDFRRPGPLLGATLLTALLLLLSSPASAQVDPGQEHPNMYVDAAELSSIRTAIDDDREPWTAAAESLISRADSFLGQSPPNVVDGGAAPPSGDAHDFFTQRPYTEGDGIHDPDADRADYRAAIKLGKSVRDLGLAYALTGESSYADKAVEFINAWTVDPATRMNPHFTNGQSKIELCITIPGMFYGADLIWNYPGWDAADRTEFVAWTASMVASAQTWSRSNNFENWRLVFLASGAVITGEAGVLQATFDQWKALISDQMTDRGEMRHELGRTNSLSYSTYALNAMTQTAEIARHHEVDLYGYELSDGRGLEMAWDYHAPFVANPSTWTREQISAYDGDNAALYELANAVLDRQVYSDAIDRWGRPMYESRVMGPTTLTHAAGLTVPPPEPVDPVFSPIEFFGDATNWEPRTASRWTVAEEEDERVLRLRTSSYESDGDRLGEYAIAMGKVYEDFTVSVRARTDESLESNDAADYAVIFGWQDPQNYVYLLANGRADYSELWVVEDGVRTSLATASTALIPDQKWHRIELSRRGSTIRVELDSDVVLEAESDRFLAGALGVGSYNDAVSFDDIDVTVPAANDPSSGTPPVSMPSEEETSDDSVDDTNDRSHTESDPTTDRPDEIRGEGGCACGTTPARVPGSLLFILLAAMMFRRSSERRESILQIALVSGLLLTTMSTTAFGYEMPFSKPACDASDPAVKIISQPSDWDAVNSSQYRIFCVRPGDYSSASIRLTADGVDGEPRYIVLDNPGGGPAAQTHPVKAAESERAIVRGLTFDDADWWVVHGLFIDGGNRLDPSGPGVDFLDSSSNNVIDRSVVQHGRGTLVQIEHGSSYNTVQNSVIRETDSDANNPSKDYHCIHIKGDKPGTLGNRFVRNEIYDCAGDSVHFSGCPYWLPNAHEINYDCSNAIDEKDIRFGGDARGTILYDNDMYITSDFKNVCGGSCACLENAIDIKSTMGDIDRSTVTSDDWVRIEKNRIWNDCSGTGSAIIAHFANSDYVLVRHNVVYKWRFGYRPTMKEDPFVDHHSVIGNVFADSEGMTSVSKIGRHLEFYKNTVVNLSDDGYNLSGYGDSDHLDLQCNAFVDAAGWSINESKVHSNWNSFYATPSFGSGADNQNFSDVADAKMEDLCFERRIWTGPETHCIPNALPTPQSPHVGHCPSDLGSYANVGVHDEIDPDFFTWYHESDELKVSITAEPRSGTAPLEVEFSTQLSGVFGAPTFAWDFGNGEASTDQNPTHTYEASGTFTAEVTVTDGNRSVYDTVDVEVTSVDEPGADAGGDSPDMGTDVDDDQQRTDAGTGSPTDEHPDTGDASDDDDEAGQDGEVPGVIVGEGGCGCTTGGSTFPGGLLLMLFAIVAARLRRAH